MDVLVFAYIVAALVSFFVAGCLLGALFSDIRQRKFARRLRELPLALVRVPLPALAPAQNMRRRFSPLPVPIPLPAYDGPPPVKTDRGWLVLYHPVRSGVPQTNELFAMLCDARTPEKILYQAAFPVLRAEKAYERENGRGVLRAFDTQVKDGMLYLYYWDAARGTVCAARTPLEPFLDEVVKSSRFAQALEPAQTDASETEEERQILAAPFLELNGGRYFFYPVTNAHGVSHIGLALSLDSKRIHERLPDPVYVPRAAFELPQKAGVPAGCTEARAVCLDDRICLIYTAHDGVLPCARAASSLSLEDFVLRRFDRWSIPSLLASPEEEQDLALLRSI